ncbi:28S rRNA (cytosine-C(5))-methyltransferase-like [Pocillopora verrucosa]|uniref:28S rRNA (cytosine-C(5))-methyltransferase-like n=1 Tax=Pocillopora verrucosa TaxID=203993 RepID=UPI0033407CAD
MAALYSCAAQIVDKVTKKQGTAKNLAINSRFPKKKKLYALVCETLKYRGILEDIFEQTRLLKLEKKLKHSYALVLVYDFLFGQGIECGGELKQFIFNHKAALQSCLALLKIRAKVHRNEDLLPKPAVETGSIPRYVRVNRIKTTLKDVINDFENNGYQLVDKQDIASLAAQSSSCKQFMCDKHLSDVLVFPAGTDLHDHPLYVSGHIILQDKASCLPAHVLAVPPGSHVIDACAAPGNKTSHVASLMNDSGKIYAFDSDRKRLTVMQTLMKKAGVECVTMTNCSFLEINPLGEKYTEVQYIVVDPSCSGSGIVNRMDGIIDEKEDKLKEEERLLSLAKFQLSVLNHALSFPHVKRVVYSTCSIHQQENEDVVEAALNANRDRFSLEHALPSWTHRGMAVFPEAERCIRASPDQDFSNGFFVALFVRNDNETVMDHKATESNGLLPGGKRKRSQENSTQPVNDDVDNDSDSAHSSAHVSLLPKKKYRKKNKKHQEVNLQEQSKNMNLERNFGRDSGKKKRKRKKKNKKVSVCS